MALQAQQVDVTELQHVGIRSTVRQMARLTPIHFYGRVFVYKRALLVRVTFKANLILRGRSPHLLGPHRTVHVVAIAALDQALVHSMMERHIELGSLLKVAGIAKLRLGLYEQKLRFFRVVWGMAGDATDVVPGMHGVDRIHVLSATGVAA